MKVITFSSLILFIFLNSNTLNAQSDELDLLNVDITVNGNLLRNPLVGGLNAPQFGEADFNNDGIQDLFVFDRTGNVVLSYINEGTANQTDYIYAAQYAKLFPTLEHWVLLRDFNDDGATDIFAYSDVPGIGGVQVYEGYYEDDVLKFERFNFYNNDQNLIYAQLSAGTTEPLYMATESYPELTDIDDDGDLDFITSGYGEGYIFLYENQSVDLGFGNDSLIYNLENTCLGGAYLSGFTGCAELAPLPDSCLYGLIGGVDGGSSILMFDEDNDGDKDIFLGGLHSSSISRLRNGGNSQSIWWNEKDCNYPSYNTSTEIFNYPASFYLDMDNDGLKDFIAAPSSPYNSEDDQNVWFYKNTTSNEMPVFDYQKNTFLVEDMVDLGTGACPAFVDYNADGLMDMIVGNQGYWVSWNELGSRLFLFENIGTANTPAYELVDDDYLNMSQFSGSNWHFSPCTGDIDNDGDIDLLIGEEFGALFFIENIAGPNQAFEFAEPVFDYMDIDVGLISSPFIVDLNRDGLMDIVVGERNGFLNYFQNQGSTGNPQFESDEDIAPNNSFLGAVDTRNQFDIEGHCAPFFVDMDGEYVLFCGSRERGIIHYTNIEDNLNGAYDHVEDFYGDIKPGIRSYLTMADVNGNDTLDIMVGNRRGGLSAYSTSLPTGEISSINHPDFSIDIELLPNPTSDFLRLIISSPNNTFDKLLLSCYNNVGQQIFNEEYSGSSKTIEVSHLPTGVYFLEITKANGLKRTVKRFVKRE